MYNNNVNNVLKKYIVIYILIILDKKNIVNILIKLLKLRR